MNKETQEIKIKYRITGIEPFPGRKSHVAILLSPVEELKFSTKPKPKVHMIGPSGMPIDGDQMHQVMSMMFSGPGSPFKKQEEQDPRDIIFVDSVLDFTQRGWKYLDVIEVAFNKVADGGDITADFLETQS